MGLGIYEPLLVVQQSVSTVVGLSNIPPAAVRALITVETQNIRYRDDGTNPTTTVGLPLNKDLPPWPYEGYLDQLKLVAQTGTAVVHIAYYGKRPENAQ